MSEGSCEPCCVFKEPLYRKISKYGINQFSAAVNCE